MRVRVEKDQGSPSNTEVASIGPSSDSSIHIVLFYTFVRSVRKVAQKLQILKETYPFISKKTCKAAETEL